MQVKEQLTYEQLRFMEGLHNSVVFFDIFQPLIHRDIEQARDYQLPILLNEDDTVVTKAGRGVGKTVALESDILKIMNENPDKEGLLTTPNKAHLEPLWNRIKNFVAGHHYWNQFKKRLISGPEYTFEAKNGFILHGRISGTSKGTGLLSLHVDFSWIDEAQLYMGTGLSQLQGCFKKGCRKRLFGVPNGIRRGYLHIAWNDPKIPDSCKNKITRLQDPSFTEEEDERLIRIYGGKNSQSYLNQVLGEDGVSTKKTFNPMYYNKCFVELEEYEIFEFNGRERNEKELDENKVPIPDEPRGTVSLALTADLGFHPDPTVIGLWAEDQKRAGTLLAKYILYNVRYTKQHEFLNGLANRAGVKNVAMDVGGPGQTVFLDLSNEDLYPNKGYNVIPVDFRANIPVGTKEKEDEYGYKERVIVKENVKYYSTLLLEGGFESKLLFLPASDLILYDEVDANTKFKNSKGIFSYVGADHHLDMMRCFMIYPLIQKGVEEKGQDGPVGVVADF